MNGIPEPAIETASKAELDTVRTLFTEYARWLGHDLSFQGFDEELSSLPGKYAPPEGRILLARCGTPPGIAGCVAVRPHSGERCEMKRLWVRPGYRGEGIGRLLVREIIDVAREIGYQTMVLDTLETMDPALKLYLSEGFSRIAAYYENPLPGVVYLGRRL